MMYRHFAFSDLEWLDPPSFQGEDLLAALANRKLIRDLVEANKEHCWTALDDDGYPVLCAGIYEYEDHGVSWAFFHNDMKREMVHCVRAVRACLQKFHDLTGKPVYVTVDEDHEDAVRWARVIRFEPKEGLRGIWWAPVQQ